MKVSVLLVTWNSAPHIQRCLDLLEKQTYLNFEVIIVDNGSIDGSLDRIQEKYPKLHIRVNELGKNTGFTVANNIGAQMARGEWLVLLNADAFPDPDWLENLVEAAEKYPNACFSSRQIQANNPEYLDGEGDMYRAIGFAKRINYNVPVYPPEKEFVEIFSPCAAAALYPRQAFLDVGGFDEDFFSYYEDVDLGFRLRLHGLEAYYLSSAVVHHVGSASTGKMSDFSVYYSHRNLVWTYLKNMPSLLFWIYLPVHLVINLFFLVAHHFSDHWLTSQRTVVWRSKKDAILSFPKMWKKRRYIQKKRKASLKKVYRAMKKRIFVRY